MERELFENRRFRAVVYRRAFEDGRCALELVEACALDRKGFEHFVGPVELARSFAAYFADVVYADKPSPAAGFCHSLFRRDSLGRKARLHCADASEFFCNRAGIDAADCGHSALFEVFLNGLLGAPAA